MISKPPSADQVQGSSQATKKIALKEVRDARSGLEVNVQRFLVNRTLVMRTLYDSYENEFRGLVCGKTPL